MEKPSISYGQPNRKESERDLERDEVRGGGKEEGKESTATEKVEGRKPSSVLTCSPAPC